MNGELIDSLQSGGRCKKNRVSLSLKDTQLSVILIFVI